MPRVCAIHAITISEGKGRLQSVYIQKSCNMLKVCARGVTLITIIKLSGKDKRLIDFHVLNKIM